MGLLRDLFAAGAVCYLEEVSGFAGQGQPGSSMFKFGSGYGFLRGCAMALGYRLELVRPQKWQKSLGIGNASTLLPDDFKARDPAQQRALRAVAKREWKRKLLAHAERLYPCQRVTLATADALLILDYATNARARGREADDAATPSEGGCE